MYCMVDLLEAEDSRRAMWTAKVGGVVRVLEKSSWKGHHENIYSTVTSSGLNLNQCCINAVLMLY
jgi:hypothetical protein